MTSNNFYKTSILSNFSSPHSVNSFSPTIRNFLNREEFESLKSQGEALDHKIKLRKDFENQYHSIKLNELDKEIEMIKYKNQIANKRNEDLLTSIQGDIYKCYQVSKISTHSKNLIDKDRKKYADYLSYQLSSIRNEFQMKILAKQNELQGIKTILENQLNHNEEVLRMENEYSHKMAKMNQDLAEKIRILHERNKKIDGERRDMMKTYSHMEEKTREAFIQIFNEKEVKEEKKAEGLVDGIKIEELIRKFKEEKIIENEEKKKDHCDGQDKSIINEYSKVKEKSPAKTQKERSLSKNKSKDKSKDESQDKNNVKKVSKNTKKDSETKKYTHTPGVLDRIRNQQKDDKIRSSKASSKKKIENKSKSKERKDTQDTTNKRNQALDRIKNRNKEKSDLLDKQISISLEKEEDKNDKSMIFDDEKINFKKKEPNTNIKVDINNKQIDTLTNDEKSAEIVKDNPEQTSQSLNKISLEKAPSIKKKSSLEILLDEKPELIKVKKDLKLQVLKKIQLQIEKIAKGVKPNNPSTYIYQSKHMNISNISTIKNKFYDILSILHDSNDTTKDISSISIDNLIFIQFAILNTNSNLNLNPDNLAGDYNEQLLTTDLDDNITEIFNLITEHMKKIVMDKKTSPNMAANILANYLINFEKDQRMVSNLVAVLERKLSQKLKTTGGWGSGGFNSKLNTFIYYINLNLETTYQSNTNNASMKSMITIPKNNATFHSTSNIITKTNETGGIINDFNEIE